MTEFFRRLVDSLPVEQPLSLIMFCLLTGATVACECESVRETPDYTSTIGWLELNVPSLGMFAALVLLLGLYLDSGARAMFSRLAAPGERRRGIRATRYFAGAWFLVLVNWLQVDPDANYDLGIFGWPLTWAAVFGPQLLVAHSTTDRSGWRHPLKRILLLSLGLIAGAGWSYQLSSVLAP